MRGRRFKSVFACAVSVTLAGSTVAQDGCLAAERQDDLEAVIDSLDKGRAWTNEFSIRMHFDIHCSDGRIPVRVEVPVFRRNQNLWDWKLRIVPLSAEDQRGPSTPWYIFLSDAYFVDLAIDGDPPVVGAGVLTTDTARWKELKLNAPTSGAPVLGYVWGPVDLVGLLRACPQVTMERIDSHIHLQGGSPFGTVVVDLDPARSSQPIRWSVSRDGDDLIGETPLRELGLSSWDAQLVTEAFHEVDGAFIPAKVVLTESRTFDDGTSRTDTYSYEITEVDLRPDAMRPESFGLTIPHGTIMPLRDSDGNATGVSYRWVGGQVEKLVPRDAAEYIQSAVTRYRQDGQVLQRAITSKERVEGPYCGVVCLAGLTTWFNQPFDVESAIDPVLLRSSRGISLEQILRYADERGISGKALRNLTAVDCTLMAAPSILALRSSPDTTEVNHFGLMIDASAAKSVTIIDPDGGIRTLSVAELDARFGGAALVFAPGQQVLGFRGKTFALRLGVGAALLGAIAALRITTRRHGPVSLRLGVGILVVVSILAAIAWQFMPISLDREAARFVKAQHAPTFVERIMPDQLESMIKAGTAIPIDARGALSFGRGHIRSAVHFPAGGVVHPKSSALPGASSAGTLVVYCDSDACDYDDVIIRRLAAMGYSRLAILKGGCESWTMQSGGMGL